MNLHIFYIKRKSVKHDLQNCSLRLRQVENHLEVGAEAHRQLGAQEGPILEQHLHLAAEQPVAYSTGSMRRSSDSLHKQHKGLVRRNTEHIEQSSQLGYWHLVGQE